MRRLPLVRTDEDSGNDILSDNTGNADNDNDDNTNNENISNNNQHH